MKSKALLGTTIFAYLLVIASFYKLWGFTDYYYYKFMFHHLSENIIIGRYVFSIVLRFVGIVVAIFLLLSNNKARQIFILISLFSLVMTAWKHPYQVFENIAILVEEGQGINQYPEGTVEDEETGYPRFPKDLQGYELVNPNFPRISLALYTAIDVIFAAGALLYFTRPKVKESFGIKKKNA